MKRWVSWGVAALLVVVASYFGLLLLDAGVSLDNARSEVNRLRERSGFALELIRREWLGKSVATVESLSEEFRRKGVIVSVQAGTITIDDVIFDIEAGKVRSVRYID